MANHIQRRNAIKKMVAYKKDAGQRQPQANTSLLHNFLPQQAKVNWFLLVIGSSCYPQPTSCSQQTCPFVFSLGLSEKLTCLSYGSLTDKKGGVEEKCQVENATTRTGATHFGAAQLTGALLAHRYSRIFVCLYHSTSCFKLRPPPSGNGRTTRHVGPYPVLTHSVVIFYQQ